MVGDGERLRVLHAEAHAEDDEVLCGPDDVALALAHILFLVHAVADRKRGWKGQCADVRLVMDSARLVCACEARTHPKPLPFP